MTQHDFDLIRDLHKEARGRRPSYDWDVWFDALPLAEKQVVWDDLVAESNQRDADEASAEQRHCRQFRETISSRTAHNALSIGCGITASFSLRLAKRLFSVLTQS